MPVYGESADLTGTRSNDGNGLVGSGGWSGATDAEFVQLDWSITATGGLFEYVYTWSGAGLDISLSKALKEPDDGGLKKKKPSKKKPAKGSGTESNISNFTLELSADCTADDKLADPGCVSDANGGPLEFGDKSGISTAVKFDFGGDVDESTVTYSFTSNRAPVWGDICVKGPGGPLVKGAGASEFCPISTPTDAYLLHNAGFGNPGLDNVLNYVARPNGVSMQVAAPGVLALMGLGLGLLGLSVAASRRA